LVDREDAQSVVHTGPLRGATLHDLWVKNRDAIFGTAYAGHPAERFPMLIKILDARERLSVQVHPPATVAPSLGGEPKTEMWYFADALPGATIYAGLKRGVTRDGFEHLLRQSRVEEALHAIPVETGQSIFIPSGRLHAIGEGNVIVEIQQNSDTTYRVFDWNRSGLDGQPRKLHLEESLLSTDFEDFEPGIERISEGILAECPYFKVEKISLPTPAPAAPDGRFAVLTVLTGKAKCAGTTFSPGEFFLVPAALADATVEPAAPSTTLLRSTLPV
jgi:mannose-6-phosphate isomerase